MTVELGDIITIDDITMTCVQERKTFLGISYMFIYFSCGDLKEVCFSAGELDALGATKREKAPPRPPRIPPQPPAALKPHPATYAIRMATRQEIEDGDAKRCAVCATKCPAGGQDEFCICNHFIKRQPPIPNMPLGEE